MWKKKHVKNKENIQTGYDEKNKFVEFDRIRLQLT